MRGPKVTRVGTSVHVPRLHMHSLEMAAFLATAQVEECTERAWPSEEQAKVEIHAGPGNRLEALWTGLPCPTHQQCALEGRHELPGRAPWSC